MRIQPVFGGCACQASLLESWPVESTSRTAFLQLYLRGHTEQPPSGAHSTARIAIWGRPTTYWCELPHDAEHFYVRLLAAYRVVGILSTYLKRPHVKCPLVRREMAADDRSVAQLAD